MSRILWIGSKKWVSKYKKNKESNEIRKEGFYRLTARSRQSWGCELELHCQTMGFFHPDSPTLAQTHIHNTERPSFSNCCCSCCTIFGSYYFIMPPSSCSPSSPPCFLVLIFLAACFCLTDCCLYQACTVWLHMITEANFNCEPPLTLCLQVVAA